MLSHSCFTSWLRLISYCHLPLQRSVIFTVSFLIFLILLCILEPWMHLMKGIQLFMCFHTHWCFDSQIIHCRRDSASKSWFSSRLSFHDWVWFCWIFTKALALVFRLLDCIWITNHIFHLELLSTWHLGLQLRIIPVKLSKLFVILILNWVCC